MLIVAMRARGALGQLTWAADKGMSLITLFLNAMHGQPELNLHT
jgi:hypothetical protein